MREQTSKIVDFDQLNIILESKKPNSRIVQCHGVFDLLHVGHIKHFQTAKSHGDILVVTITPDHFVNKGPGHPAFQESLRAQAIAALECVDYVVINNYSTAVEAITAIRPNFYIKGAEYEDPSKDLTGRIQEEIDAVRGVGGEVVFTNDITFSSSTLINQYFPSFPNEVVDFLLDFKKRFEEKTIFEYFEKAKKLHILVVGEAIIDIYHFSEVIGKAGKEPILVAKHRKKEVYAGGILAIANHLSEFCAQVTCLTYLGENGEYEDVIRQSLKPNIELVPIYKNNAPTIVKRRYLEEYLEQKLFEVCEINDDFFDEQQQREFLEKLKQLVPAHDLAVVADYGHGLFSQETSNFMTENASFLAVNTQSNASNHGFNCISKYQKADYVAIASRELQLNYRQRHLSVEEQLQQLLQDFDYQTVMITTGKSGACTARQGKEFCKVPAFASHVVDRVGAGDAVLALTSIFAYLQAPAELITFIGNVVGAEAVGIWGNKASIKKKSLLKHISHLLK